MNTKYPGWRSSLKRPRMAHDRNYRPQSSWKFLSKSTSFSRSCTCRTRVEEFMRDPRLGECTVSCKGMPSVALLLRLSSSRSAVEMRDELPLLWRLWRVSHDSLAGAGCGELVDRALHAVVLAIALLRDPPVVIGRPRLQAAHAHAENSLWMGPRLMGFFPVCLRSLRIRKQKFERVNWHS